MEFNNLVNQIFFEMAKVNVSDLSRWPSYTHPEFEKTSPVFQNKYGKKYTPDVLLGLIKNAVLEISKDPNLSEIEDKDLVAQLVKAFRSGSMSPTTADVISKRAVRQLLDFIKTQPASSKQEVAQIVAVAAKKVEDNPRQGLQIAAQAAQDSAEVVSQVQPEPSTNQPDSLKPSEETPEGNIEMPSGEVLTKNEKLEIFNSTVTLTVGYYENFLEKIKTFNLKSAKKDIPPIEVQFVKTHQKETRNEQLINLVDFKVIIPPLILGGAAGRYKFVAKIDHTQNNVISIIPGTANEQDVINKYAEAKGRCERVGCADRKRNATFIVQDTSNGKLIQLGSVCLEKYIGGAERSIISLLNSLEGFTKEILGLIEKTYQEGEGGGGGGGSVDINKMGYAISDVLGFGLMLTKSEGFKPKAAGEKSTSERIKLALSGEANNIIWRERNSERAKDAQWLVNKRIQFDQEKDSYTQSINDLVQWGLQEYSKPAPDLDKASLYYNAKTLLGMTKDPSGGFIKGYSIGKVVWVIPKFLEATDENFKRPTKESDEKKISNYIGVVGAPIGDINYKEESQTYKKRLKASGADLTKPPYNGNLILKIKNYFINSSDMYGPSTVIFATDESGNVFKWKITGRLSPEQEKAFQAHAKISIFRAVVKDHSTYIQVQLKNIQWEGLGPTNNNQQAFLQNLPKEYKLTPSIAKFFNSNVPETKEQALALMTRGLGQNIAKAVDCEWSPIINEKQTTLKDVSFEIIPTTAPTNESISFADYYSLKN